MKRRERWIPLTLGLGTLVLGAGIWFAWPVARHAFDPGRQLRPYSIPSESMKPTLEPGDHIYPRNVALAAIRRGDVLVFRLGSETRIGRVAALAGDRIGIAAGIVSLNGQPVAQMPHGEQKGEDGRPVRRLLEQFPGEAGPHAILDAGPAPQDDVAPVMVPVGHIFVLGDNRDNSMDSRFPIESFGMGMLPLTAVIGRIDFIAWSTRLSGRFDRPITKIDR